MRRSAERRVAAPRRWDEGTAFIQNSVGTRFELQAAPQDIETTVPDCIKKGNYPISVEMGWP